MPNLTCVSQELFRRTPDYSFESLAALAEHCCAQHTNLAQASGAAPPGTPLLH